MPDISKTPRNGSLRTPEAYILARGVNTIPYHVQSSAASLVDVSCAGTTLSEYSVSFIGPIVLCAI
eukprot:6185541-Pleurochrysis_carterae.AAC.3